MARRAGRTATGISPAGIVNRGFTLIELVVVTLLLGIILFVAAPRVREIIAGDPLEIAGRRLAALGGELRAEAVREGKVYHLALDLEDGRFFTFPRDSSPEELSRKREKAWSLGEGVRLVEVDPIRKDKIFTGEAIIRFFPNGYAEPAIIYLERGEERASIFIHPVLPVVKVWRRHRSREEVLTGEDGG